MMRIFAVIFLGMLLLVFGCVEVEAPAKEEYSEDEYYKVMEQALLESMRLVNGIRGCRLTSKLTSREAISASIIAVKLVEMRGY